MTSAMLPQEAESSLHGEWIGEAPRDLLSFYWGSPVRGSGMYGVLSVYREPPEGGDTLLRLRSPAG